MDEELRGFQRICKEATVVQSKYNSGIFLEELRKKSESSNSGAQGFAARPTYSIIILI
jgi:hypothetical protein